MGWKVGAIAKAYITRICPCGERRISDRRLLENPPLNDFTGYMQSVMRIPYLRDTSHRTGGELVDKWEWLLRLVGHDGRPVDLKREIKHTARGCAR